jgi:hypothetical protein
MQTKFASLLKTTVAVAAIAVLAVSCKKETENASPLATQNKTAAVTGISSATITGRWGNPALGPSAFGTVYFKFTGAQDTVGTSAPYDVLFTSTNNSVVQVPAGYTLKFLYNTSIPFANLKVSDFTSAAVGSVGRNTATAPAVNGWYNYVVPAGVTPITGAYLLVTTDLGDTYALRLVSAAGQGTATNNRGVYGIEYGAIDNN